MKRKYDNPKVKVGDLVYIKDLYRGYESLCKYKVIAIGESEIIVEVKDNEKDQPYFRGWLTDEKFDMKKQYNLPSGIKAWFVSIWNKAGGKCLNIE